MGRLIDAEKAKTDLKHWCMETAINNIEAGICFPGDVYADVAQNRIDVWIDNIPTVDAVEVVRCKDCVLRWSACPMVVRSMDENGGLRVSFFTEDDDYCSRGKK